MKIKKILAILLATVFSLTGTSVFAESQTKEEDYKVTAVFALGLMDADVSGDKQLDAEASRLDFAISLYKALNYESQLQQGMASRQIYSDVDLLHYGASYLEYLTDLGITTGYGDGTFKYSDGISLDEAYTMSVRCAGCFRHADTNIQTIRDIADRIGIGEGIRCSNSQILSRLDMAHILYNLMFCDYTGFSGTEGGLSVYKSDSSFLEEVMNLSYVDGIVSAYDGITLYDERVNTDEITVGGKSYKSMISSDTDWLGMRARVIYDIDSETALAIFAPKKNSTLVIDAQMLEKYTGSSYVYDDNGRQKKANISQNADILYNDYVSFNKDLMMPACGKILLVDNDGDKTYDVVRVFEYESYVLSGVSTVFEGAQLQFKNSDENGQKIAINVKDYDKVRIDSSWDGIEKKVGQMKADTVITICRSANKVLSIWTCKDQVEVSKIKIDRNYYEKQVIIDGEGTEYGMVNNIYVTGWDMSGIKDAAVLYLDVNGYVAAIICEDVGGDWKYAYVLTLKYDEEEDQLVMKILTQDNVVERKSITEKVTLDGTVYKNMSEACENMMSAYENFINATTDGKERVSTRLLRYYEKNGVVKKLDTPVIQSLYDTKKYLGFGDDNCLMLRTKGNIYSKRVNGNMTFKIIYPTDAEILGEVNLKNSSAPVFIVPPTLTGDENYEDDYLATTLGKANITHEKFFYGSGYNTDPEALACDILVIRTEIGLSDTTQITIVDNVMQMIGADGEVCYGVTSYFSGKKSSVMEIMRTSKVAGTKLKKGDVIKYQQAGNSIAISEILYRPDGTVGTLNIKPVPDDGNMNSSCNVCCNIERQNGDWLQIKAPRNLTALIPVQNRVLIYDVGTKQLSIGTSSDVKTVETYGENADVFIYYIDKYSVTGACAIRGVK